MRVAGLDVSTKAAHYTIWDGKSAVAYGAMTEREEVSGLLRMNVDVVYIEQIPFIPRAGHQTMRKLCEAVGVWRERCEAVGLTVKTIPVSEWKVMSLGRGFGTATKDQVRAMILATTDVPLGQPQDIYDACGVAISGYQTEKMNAKMAGVLAP